MGGGEILEQACMPGILEGVPLFNSGREGESN